MILSTQFVMGILFHVSYRPIDNNEIDDKDHVATQSYIAGAIYFACFGGCLLRALWLFMKGKQNQEARYDFESST
jgi:hypothetical protein